MQKMTDSFAPLHPALERYRDGGTTSGRCYPDLHEHVLALARAGLLLVIDEPIARMRRADVGMNTPVEFGSDGSSDHAD